MAQGTAICAALLAAAWAASCSSIETLNFSNGDCVADGCATSSGATTTTSTGGPCTVNFACTISFKQHVFPILDGPAGCTTTGICHGDGKGGILLETGKPAEALAVLTGYTLLATPGPMKKYIVPCDPAASGFTCNMVLTPDAGPNPYDTCGSPMPSGKNKLSQEELTTIAEWIQCGAPDN